MKQVQKMYCAQCDKHFDSEESCGVTCCPECRRGRYVKVVPESVLEVRQGVVRSACEWYRATRFTKDASIAEQVLLLATDGMPDHEFMGDEFDVPCMCDECRSYA